MTEQNATPMPASAETPKAAPKRPEPKWFPKFEASLPDQSGKTVAITGTTSGTGLAAAKTSLKKGAVTFLLNRNEQKARNALSTFFEENKEAESKAHFITCDLQSFDSVKEAAQEVISICKSKDITALDALCNNAGVMAMEDKASGDGYDVQMQTNHLSHFLLTKQLFPLLVKSNHARIVNHSSSARLGLSSLKARYLGKNGGNLGGNGSSMLFGARWERYHQTKLANSVFTVELKKRLVAAGIKNVITTCAHPGLAFTELQVTTQQDGGLSGIGFMKNAQSPEDGAMGILRGLFGEVKNGALYGPFMMTGPATERSHGLLTTAAAGKMLWNESEKACGEFDLSKAV